MIRESGHRGSGRRGAGPGQLAPNHGQVIVARPAALRGAFWHRRRLARNGSGNTSGRPARWARRAGWGPPTRHWPGGAPRCAQRPGLPVSSRRDSGAAPAAPRLGCPPASLRAPGDILQHGGVAGPHAQRIEGAGGWAGQHAPSPARRQTRRVQPMMKTESVAVRAPWSVTVQVACGVAAQVARGLVLHSRFAGHAAPAAVSPLPGQRPERPR